MKRSLERRPRGGKIPFVVSGGEKRTNGRGKGGGSHWTMNRRTCPAKKRLAELAIKRAFHVLREIRARRVTRSQVRRVLVRSRCVRVYAFTDVF